MPALFDSFHHSARLIGGHFIWIGNHIKHDDADVGCPSNSYVVAPEKPCSMLLSAVSSLNQ
jgi:hypothetical protein